MMMMKTGTKTLIFVSALCGMYTALKYSKPKKNHTVDTESDPSKFGNRLKEFFFEEDLTNAIQQYLSLIDAGLNPKDAYEIVRTKI
jgi:hypothetical protein